MSRVIWDVEPGNHSTYESVKGERVLYTEEEMVNAVEEYVEETGYKILTPEDFDSWSDEREPSSNNLVESSGFVYDGIEIFGDRWDIYRRKDIDDFLIQLDIETE